MPTISATTRSALPSITFTLKALRSPITRFCSIFTLRCRQNVSGPGAESIEKGYALVGTADTVTRTLEKLRRRLPIEWVFCYTYNSLVPHDVLMKTIERFWTEVMPRVA